MGCFKRYAVVGTMVVIGFGLAARKADDAFSFSYGGETFAGDTNTGVTTTWTVAGVAGGADQLFLDVPVFRTFGGGAINLITPEVYRSRVPTRFSSGTTRMAAGRAGFGSLWLRSHDYPHPQRLDRVELLVRILQSVGLQRLHLF